MYEKLMKTPSNPQFSPFGPIKCREKTLINTKFLNSKVCFGGPRSYLGSIKTIGKMCDCVCLSCVCRVWAVCDSVFGLCVFGPVCVWDCVFLGLCVFGPVCV